MGELLRYCNVEMLEIDDFVFGGNYSATLTLAYERGMRAAGQMCETYFFYLVSDYIMANGSLAGLMPYMERGVSAITTGNFQVVDKAMCKVLEPMIDENGILSIPPRTLMTEAFRHLHPLTLANTINQTLSHATHSNRLFWRVDESILVGRFYLRHMICIKPEIENYVIGASCDYSYVAEMCPSGNVVAIADSDEYCVVELQPHFHESAFIECGPAKQADIVKELSHWTTKEHRANARIATIFHSGEISPSALAQIESTALTTREIEQSLDKPMPTRGHPYWISCIEYIMQHLLSRRFHVRHYQHGMLAGLLDSPVFAPPLGTMGSDFILLRTNRQYKPKISRRVLNRILDLTSGVCYKPSFFHPYWRDYAKIQSHLRHSIPTSARILCISYTQHWLVDQLQAVYDKRIIFQQGDLFARRPVEWLSSQLGDCRHVILIVTRDKINSLGPVLARIRQLIASGGTVHIYAIRRLESSDMKAPLAISLANASPYFEGLKTISVLFCGRPLGIILDPLLRRLVYRSTASLGRPISSRRLIMLSILVGISVSYIINNILGILKLRASPNQASSAIFSLRVN